MGHSSLLNYRPPYTEQKELQAALKSVHFFEGRSVSMPTEAVEMKTRWQVSTNTLLIDLCRPIARWTASFLRMPPPHDVSPNQGKLLHIFARMINARRVLEIGTLGRYSTIWLSRALPEGGRVVTLEVDPAHADVARSNIERAGLAQVVEIHVGSALESLQKLPDDQPFDLIFISGCSRAMPRNSPVSACSCVNRSGKEAVHLSITAFAEP